MRLFEDTDQNDSCVDRLLVFFFAAWIIFEEKRKMKGKEDGESPSLPRSILKPGTRRCVYRCITESIGRTSNEKDCANPVYPSDHSRDDSVCRRRQEQRGQRKRLGASGSGPRQRGGNPLVRLSRNTSISLTETGRGSQGSQACFQICGFPALHPVFLDVSSPKHYLTH